MKRELLSLAEELDPMGESPYKDAVEALPEKMIELFGYTLRRAFYGFDNIGGDVELRSVNADAGITVRIQRDHYAKCCHVGRDIHHIDLSWAELLDSNCGDIAEQKFQRAKRFEEEREQEERRREQEACEKRQQAARIATMPNPY